MLIEKGSFYLLDENLKEVNVYFKIRGGVCVIYLREVNIIFL